MSTTYDPSNRADLEQAAASGDAKAMYDLGYFLETSTPRDRSGAREWYERAAAAGHTAAYFRLGYLLDDSRDQRDHRTAIGWYEKASEHGDEVAMFNIGIICQYRLDPPDYRSARHWYERAATAGYADAYFRLAFVLDQWTTPRDFAGARHWYEKAAENGDGIAMFNIGCLFEAMDPPDYASALPWFVKAAEANYDKADFTVGNLLDKRIEPRDPLGARRWYEKAAAHGDSRADYALAELAEREGDPMFIVLYERAAAAGSAAAMNYLGHRLWMRPSGRNEAAATAWFERSAANGFEMAKSNLVKIGVVAAPDESAPARGIPPEVVRAPVSLATLGFAAAGSPTGVTAALDAAIDDSPYRRNAFRLADLPTDADGRRIRKRVTEFEAAERLGAPLTIAPLLPMPSQPEPGEAKTALNQLREPAQRLIQELFWIWPGEDGPRPGDLAGMERIWLERLPRAGIAAHNLAVVRHIQAMESPLGRHAETWLDALTAWDAAICAADSWEWLRARTEAIGDSRVGTAALAELRAALPAALLRLHTDLMVRAAIAGDRPAADLHTDVLTRFAEQIAGRPSSFDPAAVDSARDLAVRKLAAHTRTLADDASRAAQNDPRAAGAVAGRLLDNAKLPLLIIDRLRPATDPIGSGAHDDLVRTAISCDIAQFNETRSVPTSLSILERLTPLATTRSILDRLATEWATTSSANVAHQCTLAREKTATDPTKGAQLARDLLADTQEPLARMRSAPQPNTEAIDAAHDRIATTVIHCVVGYFNRTGDLDATVELMDRIRPTVRGKDALDYLREQDTVLTRIRAEREQAERLRTYCWFCGRQPGADPAKYRVGLHNNVTRRGNTTRWQSLHIDVPRCEQCRIEHAPGARLRGFGGFLGFIGFLAAFIGGIAALGASHPPGAIGAAVIGVVAILIGVAMSKSQTATQAPNRAFEYPRVQQLLAEGWRKGERP
ncbi:MULTISPECIES: tetratricopeptide repeat protein [unclassified Nocardia]|uniref:tetratricopeptide repeat protein n=1 Tax=unclassified Nocardia TaxID=2637762 RepID=UPI001CE4AC8D|nr:MULTISPECIES: tetratricopeptide repeat protein [unclassified Nocardia]